MTEILMDKYFFHSGIMVNRVARSIALAGLGAYSAFSFASAQSADMCAPVDASKRASARLEAKMQSAMILVEEGRAEYKKGEYTNALQKFRQSLSEMPDTPNMEKRRNFVKGLVGDASIAVAQEYIKVGRYDEAKTLLNEALLLSSKKGLAQQVLDYMEDSVRTNPALTPNHVKDVEEVNRLLRLAYGYYELGNYDPAIAKFNAVLAIDPYNKAARNGMVTVNKAKASYYKAARDETRSSALVEVDKQWERPLDSIDFIPDKIESNQPMKDNWLKLDNKLAKIIIPKVNLQDVNLSEAIEFIRTVSRRNDQLSPVEAEKGINIMLELGHIDSPEAQAILSKQFSLILDNVTLKQLLDAVTRATGTAFKTNAYGVEIVSNTGSADYPVTHTIKVPMGFFSSLAAETGEAESEDVFSSSDTGRKIKEVIPVDVLRRAGLKLPEGSIISYKRPDSTLFFHGPISDWRLLEDIVSAREQMEPLQVIVTTTMIEVDQSELDELGFEWLVNFADPTKLYGGGGTVNNNVPSMGPANVATGQVGGLRYGNQVFPQDGLDSLVKYGVSGVNPAYKSGSAPTFFALQGTWTNLQVSLLMKGLNQKTGADITQRPSVIVKPGQKARFYSGRDFIYPDTYEAPQIPTSGESNAGGSTPVTPAHPSDFISKAVGMVYEVEVLGISEDKNIVDLSISPEMTEFEGFVNYGSPIQMPIIAKTNDSIAANLGLEDKYGIRMLELTKNEILKPLFNVKKETTNVMIATGQTVVLGGLKKASTIRYEDKIPIMGDLPLIGRLFRSEGKEVKRKAFIIMVKAEVVDPAGKNLRGESDDLGLDAPVGTATNNNVENF